MSGDVQDIDELLKSVTHALTQVKSVLAGSQSRADRIENCKVDMDNVYGTDAGRSVSFACAHGAERDAFKGLLVAERAFLQEIEHLSAAQPS